MKALVHHRFGSPDVLELADVDKPAVDDDSVLVRVCAASVNPLDWHFLTGLPYITRSDGGLRRPKSPIRGRDLAGRVEAVGRNVTTVHPGDDVFGVGAGTFAEYARASARLVVSKPANLSFEQAACVPVAAITALQALRDKGRVERGQSVLVNGAAGGVGTFAVQIAKAFGAEVTGVCSTGNVELVRSIGADHVVDYTRDDFTTSGRRYDVIIDNVGNRAVRARVRAMKPSGRCVIVGGPKGGRLLGPASAMLRAIVGSVFVRPKFVPFLAKETQADLLVLRDLLESGTVSPVVGATYALADVPEALRVIESGHARGKLAVAVQVATGSPPQAVERREWDSNPR